MIDKADTHARITRVVAILLEQTGETQAQLARVLDVDESCVSRSMRLDARRPREWSVHDVLTMAVHFEIDPGTFFTATLDDLHID